MTAPRRAAAPRGLAAHGRRTWVALTSTYRFDPAELAVLEQACRTLDDADRLTKEAAGAPAMVEGSSGQPRANPIGVEVRATRALAGKLLGQLRVSMAAAEKAAAAKATGSTPAGQRSSKARAAAMARWGGPGRGRGA